MAINKKFHFITGLAEDFGGKPFSFIHYLAVKSAISVNPGFSATIYFAFEPDGPYWDLVRKEANCVRVIAPTEVHGRTLRHFAHRADVLRLQLLIESGGVYLDLDTICQNPLEPLLTGHPAVMGTEKLADGHIKGLCNAVILAERGAEFLRLWLDAYRDFSDENWSAFSVELPMRLALDRPDLVHIEPAESFFWPSWDGAGIDEIFRRAADYPAAYLLHLWESHSWQAASRLDARSVLARDTTYNRIARRFVTDELLSPAMLTAAALARAKQAFANVYGDKRWGKGSGSGSLPSNNREYMNFVSSFIERNAIRSVVDLGCGDWQFSRFIDWSHVRYTGFDVVEDVVAANQRGYGSENVEFRLMTGVEGIPAADLLLCKDVFQHLPLETVANLLTELRRRFKFLLITNDEYPTHFLSV